MRQSDGSHHRFFDFILIGLAAMTFLTALFGLGVATWLAVAKIADVAGGTKQFATQEAQIYPDGDKRYAERTSGQGSD